MGTRVLAALAVGAVLVAAGFVSSIVSAPGTAAAQDDTGSTESDAPFPRILGFLGDVLDELVGDGTIDQSQADAIADAVHSKAEEAVEARRELHEQIRGFLEDGVITEEEAAQLPEDHPLLSDFFDEAWADGELTRHELGNMRHNTRRDWFHRGLRFGSLLDDGGIDQEEYDSLPDDHPLKQADVSEYLGDGLITPDELREILHDSWGAKSDASA